MDDQYVYSLSELQNKIKRNKEFENYYKSIVEQVESHERNFISDYLCFNKKIFCFYHATKNDRNIMKTINSFLNDTEQIHDKSSAQQSAFYQIVFDSFQINLPSFVELIFNYCNSPNINETIDILSFSTIPSLYLNLVNNSSINSYVNFILALANLSVNRNHNITLAAAFARPVFLLPFTLRFFHKGLKSIVLDNWTDDNAEQMITNQINIFLHF